jgi:hypothetical protein
MKLDTSTDPQVGYRPAGTLDAATALDRYTGPFARRAAAHLLRRAGFGGTPSEVDALAALGADAAVDQLLHPAEPDIAFPDAPDAALLTDPKTRQRAAQYWWLDRMLRTDRSPANVRARALSRLAARRIEESRDARVARQPLQRQSAPERKLRP